MLDPVGFSLDLDDRRFFGNCIGLGNDFVAWLERFVGPVIGRWDNHIEGTGWGFGIISTDGITDASLTFDDPKHAAVFKLTFPGVEIA